MELRLDRFSAQERDLIERALAFAKHQHRDQKRIDGKTPYIVHPIAVAQSLIDEFDADAETVAAGLLHDTVEDTGARLEDIGREFGEKVRFLVDGATDYGQNDGNPHIDDKMERSKDSKLKALRHAASDGRVIIVKAADRMDNIRNILKHGVFTPRGQVGYAYDTLAFHVLQLRKAGLIAQAEELERLCDAIIARWGEGLPAPLKRGPRAPLYR